MVRRPVERRRSVEPDAIDEDMASGKRDDRPGMDACLKALRSGDILAVRRLDRLGRSLRHPVETVDKLNKRGAGPRVLSGQGAQVDTTTPAGKLVFGVSAAFSECEWVLIVERTKGGLQAAHVRDRKGGRKFALTKAQVRVAQAAMARDQSVTERAAELDVKAATIDRHVGPHGRPRERGAGVLERGQAGYAHPAVRNARRNSEIEPVR